MILTDCLTQENIISDILGKFALVRSTARSRVQTWTLNSGFPLFPHPSPKPLAARLPCLLPASHGESDDSLHKCMWKVGKTPWRSGPDQRANPHRNTRLASHQRQHARPHGGHPLPPWAGLAVLVILAVKSSRC